jgi:hypothetical protein
LVTVVKREDNVWPTFSGQRTRLSTRCGIAGSSHQTCRFLENVEELAMTALAIRLPTSVHQKIRELAARDDVSVNQFIASAVSEKMAS